MHAFNVKKLATSVQSAVKRWKTNKKKEMTLRSKTRNLPHRKDLNFVFIAKEQFILQKSAATVPMTQTDLNGSNKTNQQLVQKKG